MTGRRRWRWIRAKLHREVLASYWWHRYLVQSMTWPFRDPHTWWYYRRMRRGLERGVWIIQA